MLAAIGAPIHFNQGSTLEQQAKAIINKYSASIYLPSTQNFSDNLGVTPAVNDGLVGYVGSGNGDANSHPATQSTAGFKPQLKANGRPNYWLFDGTDDRLSLSGPLFQMSDDHFVVACAKPLEVSVAAENQYIVAPAMGATVTHRIASLSYNRGASTIQASWYDGTNYAHPEYSWANSATFVASSRKVGVSKELRVNGVSRGADTTTTVTLTATRGEIGADSLSPITCFNGPIYCVIAGKGTITDAELLVLERYAASLGGIQI